MRNVYYRYFLRGNSGGINMVNKELIQDIRIKIQKAKTEYKRLQQINDALFTEYCEMQGRYGTPVFDDWHEITYKYSSPRMKALENELREQYLIDNNFESNQEKMRQLSRELTELDNQLCIAQYGMSRREYDLRAQLKQIDKGIEERLSRKAEIEQKIRALQG